MESFSSILEREIKTIEKQTGLQCVVTNDERIMCPEGKIIHHWTKGSEVLVKYFPPTKSEASLFYLFNECGRILQTRMFVNNNGENKGYACVLFETPGEARCATKHITNTELRCFNGRYHLKVMILNDCRRIRLDFIPRHLKERELRHVIYMHSRGVKNLIYISDTISLLYKNKGYCFVDYYSHEDAQRAKNRLSNVLPEYWSSSIVDVTWADVQPKDD